jgi:hypothetical protein
MTATDHQRPHETAVVRRPVQQSLLPELRRDRPIGRLPGSVVAGTNADLMAHIAPLYLSGSVLDVTFGRGSWWTRFTPEPFAWHDLALDGVDYRALPEPDASFDTVCFDPPYVPAGGAPTTSGAADFRDRYGLTGYRSQRQLDTDNRAGLAECARVARRFVLVKCSDYVSSGRFTLGHATVLGWADGLGLDVHDLIVHHGGTGPDGGNIIDVLRCRRAHSFLLVLSPSPTGGRT